MIYRIFKLNEDVNERVDWTEFESVESESYPHPDAQDLGEKYGVGTYLVVRGEANVYEFVVGQRPHYFEVEPEVAPEPQSLRHDAEVTT